jgi:hypothetical protein
MNARHSRSITTTVPFPRWAARASIALLGVLLIVAGMLIATAMRAHADEQATSKPGYTPHTWTAAPVTRTTEPKAGYTPHKLLGGGIIERKSKPGYTAHPFTPVLISPTAAERVAGDHSEQADGCDHGATGKPCKDDPQPSHGKDCELHGQNGGTNEDHCASSSTSSGTSTSVTSTSGTTSSTTSSTSSSTSSTTSPSSSPTREATVPPTTTLTKPPYTRHTLQGRVIIRHTATVTATNPDETITAGTTPPAAAPASHVRELAHTGARGELLLAGALGLLLLAFGLATQWWVRRHPGGHR